ncbi:uncharacterized protein [Amphiura filiformis]|uniref:uncharacterized protein n=1 Tax=Amphiura filiformis TaxID=82378 RepID=UPI003B228EDD
MTVRRRKHRDNCRKLETKTNPWCSQRGRSNQSGLFDTIILDSSAETTCPSSLNLSRSSSTSSCQPGSPLAKSSPAKQSGKQAPRGLRALEINFQSIYSKREEFWSLVDAVKPDVIYGCETWLKPSMSQAEVFPPGYDLYRVDRKGGHGGVIIGIHNSLNNHQLSLDTEAEFVAAKIINGNQSIIVAALYRPTDNNQVYMDELNRSITHLCASNPGAAIWIAGDANLPDINWENNTIVSHQYKISINQSFLQMLDATGLEQVIDFPTRGDNILDIVITNRPSLVNRCCSLPGLSDHDVVFMDMNVRAFKRKPIRRKILLWKRTDFDSIIQRLKKWAENYTSTYSTSTPVEELAEAMQSELDQVIEEHVPSKLSSTRYSQPWFNSSTKSASRRKARAFKKARRTGRIKDWKRFRHLKKESQKSCRLTYNQYVYDIVCSAPGSSNKKLGALVKSKRCNQMGVAPLKDGGYLHADPKVKANILNKQFTSVFSVDNSSALPELGPRQNPPMSNITVDLNGVIKLLKNLKPHTASGPDGIPAKLLKETAEELAPAVTLLFQASINQGRVPSHWKKACIVPIYKKEADQKLPTTAPSL